VSWLETQVAKCPQELHVKLDQPLLTTFVANLTSAGSLVEAPEVCI
jgi:hypothetical protein